MLQTGARVGATSGRSLVGAAERDEPCTALSPAGPDPPGAQGVGPRLPAVHRRVQDRRSASRESTPRCASLVAELLQAMAGNVTACVRRKRYRPGRDLPTSLADPLPVGI